MLENQIETLFSKERPMYQQLKLEYVHAGKVRKNSDYKHKEDLFLDPLLEIIHLSIGTQKEVMNKFRDKLWGYN